MEIHYLDLKTEIKDNSFVTSTFFKGTDRDSFILMGSCHHDPWLRSVPKSQYLRLRRNCSDPHQFLVQAGVLTGRFLEKGYQKEFLADTLDLVNATKREDLLVEREPCEGGFSSMGVPFITSYSLQHRNIRKLIDKHWHIATNDAFLKDVLPDRPQVIFRGAPSLRNQVALNVLNPPVTTQGFFDQ